MISKRRKQGISTNAISKSNDFIKEDKRLIINPTRRPKYEVSKLVTGKYSESGKYINWMRMNIR